MYYLCVYVFIYLSIYLSTQLIKTNLISPIFFSPQQSQWWGCQPFLKGERISPATCTTPPRMPSPCFYGSRIPSLLQSIGKTPIISPHHYYLPLPLPLPLLSSSHHLSSSSFPFLLLHSSSFFPSLSTDQATSLHLPIRE